MKRKREFGKEEEKGREDRGGLRRKGRVEKEDG